MSKPERLEDLGRICERLRQLLENWEDTYSGMIQTKHSSETFFDFINNEESSHDHHAYFRGLYTQVEEIYNISQGDRFED
jgi:hypothetical protein